LAVKVSPQLHEALALYAELEQAVISAGRRSDPGRKLDLVRARRKFAEQLGRIGILIVQDRQLAATPDIQKAMNKHFTTFRYALGQHQADWPAVRIDEDPEGYARSAWEAYYKSDQFWEWCLANLEVHPPITTRPDRIVSRDGPRYRTE